MNDNTGMIQDERFVMGRLVVAWNAFLKLEDLDQDDLNDFRQALHTCQRIIATRVVSRDHPDYWRNDGPKKSDHAG